MKYVIILVVLGLVGCANLDTLMEQDAALEGKIASKTVDAIVDGANAICAMDPSSKITLDEILATENIKIEVSCK